MVTNDPAVELVAAMGAVGQRLAERELRREHPDAPHTSSSVRASNQTRENLPSVIDDADSHFGPGIEVFLAIRFQDDSWAEWFGWAINKLDGRGWIVEREVSLDVPDGRPEVNRVASTELEEVTIGDSLTLARTLPSLVEELIALPIPRPPSAEG
jgi:hypothetical protein